MSPDTLFGHSAASSLVISGSPTGYRQACNTLVVRISYAVSSPAIQTPLTGYRQTCYTSVVRRAIGCFFGPQRSACSSLERSPACAQTDTQCINCTQKHCLPLKQYHSVRSCDLFPYTHHRSLFQDSSSASDLAQPDTQYTQCTQNHCPPEEPFRRIAFCDVRISERTRKDTHRTSRVT